MRRPIMLLAAIAASPVALVGVSATMGNAAAGQVYYVAPHGNDNAAGFYSNHHPVANDYGATVGR